MQLSANYGLKLMEGTDNVKRQDFVDNFTTIDTTMKSIENKTIPYATASGTNSYTVTINGITAYTDGLTVRVKIGNASTGASSLNINGLGAKTILDSLGNAITSGGLKAGLPYQLCYNGTNFIVLGKGGGGDATAAQLLLGKKATVDSGQIVGTLDLTNLVTGNIKSGVTINGVSGKASVVDTSDALATAAQILSGASAYVNGIKVVGSMVNQPGTVSVTGYWADGNGTLNQWIPYGAYLTDSGSGSGTPNVRNYDANFVAANIISGKSIFGVAGSALPMHYQSGTALSEQYSSQYYSTIVNLSGVLPFVPDLVLLSWNGTYTNQGALINFTGFGPSYVVWGIGDRWRVGNAGISPVPEDYTTVFGPFDYAHIPLSYKINSLVGRTVNYRAYKFS